MKLKRKFKETQKSNKDDEKATFVIVVWNLHRLKRSKIETFKLKKEMNQ